MSVSPITANQPATEEDRAPFVMAARYRKARAIASHLLTLGADQTVARELGASEVGRTLAAQAVDVNTPSPTTWVLVTALVAEVRP